jgi:hypothetical protein
MTVGADRTRGACPTHGNEEHDHARADREEPIVKTGTSDDSGNE